MRVTIRAGLAKHVDERLVDEVLDAHTEAKRNYHLGGLRLSAVEGGRFCEAVFRILEERCWGKSTPLGKSLDTNGLIEKLANLPAADQPDAVRLHIPRALRMVYDIRNKRDAAHLADDIDPNLQDATLVVSVLDWVMAELVRLYHDVSADAAQRIVEDLVTKTAPVIQDFDGFLKVLNPDLSASDFCLVLLYQRGAQGATLMDLRAWVRPKMRPNLKRTLDRLVNDKSYVHSDGQRYVITQAGQRSVESRRLLHEPT